MGADEDEDEIHVPESDETESEFIGAEPSHLRRMDGSSRTMSVEL